MTQSRVRAMAATVIQVGWSWMKHRKVEKLMWINFGAIVFFGGLTLLLQDERFIKVKPTIVYWIIAGALLVSASHGTVMPELVASRPPVAVDGPTRQRLKGEQVAGSAHIKTGRLADVRAIGGYVLDRKGQRHAVVMMVNHPNAHQAAPAMDELLRWVYGG